MLEVIKNVYRNIKRVSNLTLELLECPEIKEAREEFSMYGLLDKLNEVPEEGPSANARLSLYQQKSSLSSLRQLVYNESSKPQRNFSIDISEEKNFVPKGFFISNNDHYVGVIGQEEIWIIDSRSGKKIHAQDLPQFDQEDVRKSMRHIHKIVESSVSHESSVQDTTMTNLHQPAAYNESQFKLQSDSQQREESSPSNSSHQTSKSLANSSQLVSKLSNKLLEGGYEQNEPVEEESKSELSSALSSQ